MRLSEVFRYPGGVGFTGTGGCLENIGHRRQEYLPRTALEHGGDQGLAIGVGYSIGAERAWWLVVLCAVNER
ncbi:hypothetical protein D3C78_1725400 [compost metagenome]